MLKTSQDTIYMLLYTLALKPMNLGQMMLDSTMTLGYATKSKRNLTKKNLKEKLVSSLKSSRNAAFYLNITGLPGEF